MHSELADASIPGTLQPGIKDLIRLVTLDLSGNKLVNRFPTHFNTEGTLQSFKIGRNILDGDIAMNSSEILTQLLTL
uniref:Uncharacterized protein n=1 Tax=Physcomitrium patens TaxID=3218 RepID=A0A2K1L184_PHYPA|nr:hypothetical protein PHYPA_002563 [Physcomitrium patens]